MTVYVVLNITLDPFVDSVWSTKEQADHRKAEMDREMGEWVVEQETSLVLDAELYKKTPRPAGIGTHFEYCGPWLESLGPRAKCWSQAAQVDAVRLDKVRQ